MQNFKGASCSNKTKSKKTCFWKKLSHWRMNSSRKRSLKQSVKRVNKIKSKRSKRQMFWSAWKKSSKFHRNKRSNNRRHQRLSRKLLQRPKLDKRTCMNWSLTILKVQLLNFKRKPGKSQEMLNCDEILTTLSPKHSIRMQKWVEPTMIAKCLK